MVSLLGFFVCYYTIIKQRIKQIGKIVWRDSSLSTISRQHAISEHSDNRDSRMNLSMAAGYE